MSLTIDVTREERKAIEMTKLAATTENNSWTFNVKFSADQLTDMADDFKKKLDTRHYKNLAALSPDLCEKVYSKMTARPGKLVDFDVDGLKELPDAVVGFSAELIKQMELDTYKPSQQTLEE